MSLRIFSVLDRSVRLNCTADMPNTVVYFDITIGNEAAGRITFDLFDDVVPKVCRGPVTPGHYGKPADAPVLDHRELQTPVHR